MSGKQVVSSNYAGETGGKLYDDEALHSTVARLQEKLEEKDLELHELMQRHQEAIKDRNNMEEQLEAMKNKIAEADSKLSEVKAESEAFIRQKENDQQELAMIRRRSLVGGGGQIITQMYETILMRYENLRATHEDLCGKMNEETEKRTKLQKQLNLARLQDSGSEKDALVRQLQIMKESVETLQRDLSRVREERTEVKREYSLVMSERDAVHKEMDKMQEDLAGARSLNQRLESEKAQLLAECERLKNHSLSPQQGTVTSLDALSLREELYAAQQERKQALTEKEAKVREAYTAKKAHAIAMELVEKLTLERDLLRSSGELTAQQLEEAQQETKKATRWRDLAFSERNKLNHELEESRRVCDVMKEEREKLVTQLEEAVKEHDTMKESKNKLLSKLREMQVRVDTSQLEVCGNAHSHDSAIDSGEWESEPNGVFRQYRVARVLPQQHDVTVEQGYFVKYSNARGVSAGDRIVAINEVVVGGKSRTEVAEELARSSVCTLQLVKHLPFLHADSREGSREEMMRADPSSPQKRRHDGDLWTGVDGQVRLRRKEATLRHNKPSRDERAPPNEKNKIKRIANRDSTMLDSEEDSQLSSYTARSDPSHGGLKKETRRQADEVMSSPGGKKKKPKIGSSRFLWNRKKKSRSVVGTTSTRESSGGTWPRLDSPSLTNLISGGGGRLSVFMKKKSRPSISPTTFTPPDGNSAGRTPPTPLRGPKSLSPVPVGSPQQTPPSSTIQTAVASPRVTASAPTRLKRGVKKARPVSAPMGDRALSTWQHPVLASVTVTSASPKVNEVIKQISPTLGDDAFYPQRSPTLSPDQTPLSSVVVTPLLSSASPDRSAFRYSRQRSVPEQGKKLSLATCFASSLNASSPTTSRPRSAYSLPRTITTSRGPTLSVSSSHGGHESRKSKTLECKRIRIPSEASVGMKLSGSEKGSITLSTDRSTPLLFHPSTDPGTGGTSRSTSQTGSSASSLSVASSTLSTRSRRPPVSNHPRLVTMVKGAEPIGISIVSGDQGGIFVSRITEHSLASQAGLEYGDQLLEYNGVNLRNAKEEQARVIMSQTQPGDNIKFLAQYNLEKYKQSIESNLSDALGVSQPRPHSDVITHEEKDRTITPDVTPRASPHVEDTLQSQRLSEPRYVFMSEGCEHVKLIGGNVTGIYVTSVQPAEETLTHKPSELKVGDRIIEFNSVRFDDITLEHASIMMSRATSGASFYVSYEPSKFKQIYGKPGDRFYVRALFDHMVEREGALQFTRNSILLVEDTFPDYVSGLWTASMVDEQGGRATCGRIPSKVTVSKELPAMDDASSCAGSTSGKRLSGSGRRSFFKRRKPHRTSSRSSGDIRLHKSPSENSIESTMESITDPLGAYQVVEKHPGHTRRPVVVFGPHSSLVVEKLAREHTHQFVKCCLDPMKGATQDSAIIETYTHGIESRVLTHDVIKSTMAQFPQRHVLLEVSVEAIDRLHLLGVYPILVLVKFPSAKKVKENQDKTAGREKLSMKQCKEILEKQNAIERTLVSKYHGTVSVAGSPSSICASKVAKVVSHEHIKVLWLPAKSNLLNY